MKVSLANDLEIENFSGSGITDYASGNTNCIAYKKNGRVYVTQRSSIDISEDVSALGLNDRGRGIYYWEENSKLYIVNDASVYATTQDSVAVGTITTGTERITILETIGTPYLIFLDAENDKGWYMNTGETVTQIASNFPSTLCHGGTVLDGYLFVMDEDGVIYNSDVNSPTVFGATSFITAERENDKGVYLAQHHDNIASLNTRSIEFFYNASNTVGSPLNRRQDISYNIGCASGLSVWENGDVTYFIGSDRPGQMKIYEIKGFQVNPISNESLNSYITQTITQDGLTFRLEGLSMMGHDTLILTIYSLTGASPGEIVPKLSIALDTKTGLWGFIKTTVNSHTTFPIMAWTKRTGGQNATVAARTGEGIFYNGDIFNINDRLIPIDTLLGSEGIYVDGVYETDIYVGTTADNGVNIDWICRTGLVDGESPAYKYQNAENVEMENTSSSQTLTIKHSDEETSNFNTGRTIDTSKARKEIRQGGRFIRRNYQLEYSGNEQIYVKNLDLELELGL